jgi:hypothetical protein
MRLKLKQRFGKKQSGSITVADNRSLYRKGDVLSITGLDGTDRGTFTVTNVHSQWRVRFDMLWSWVRMKFIFWRRAWRAKQIFCLYKK